MTTRAPARPRALRHALLALCLAAFPTSAAPLTTAGLLAAPDRIEVQLPEGARVVAARTAWSRAPGGSSWRGRLIGPDSGTLVAVSHDGYLAAALVSSLGAWEAPPSAGELQWRRLEREQLPETECGVRSQSSQTGLEAATGATALGDAVITVLGLYSSGARAGAGGVAQIETLMLTALELANATFDNSGVDARYELVEALELDLSRYGSLPDLQTALDSMIADPALHSFRDGWRADVVAAVFEGGGGLCGIGEAMDDVGPAFAPQAYSISVRVCAVANLTVAHELGHNLGCRHNPEDAEVGPDDASFPWSFGHWVDATFRTVMAVEAPCAHGCDRVPYYSDPDRSLPDGHGGMVASGVEGSRDNAATLRATAPVAAAFRSGATPLFFHGFELDSTGGWSTVAPAVTTAEAPGATSSSGTELPPVAIF